MEKAASTWGASRMPSSSMAWLPEKPRGLVPSSSGWNISFTQPFSSLSCSFSSFAAPSSMAVCRSWPQVWAASPLAAKARPDSSLMGRASMSARSRMVLPPGLPRVATTPALLMRRGS